MKNIKNNIKLFAAVAATAMGVSSCSLDMLPLNDVVLENFWTDKTDVESVVASCYQATKEGSYITNMIVWGEGRSDNVDVGGNISDDPSLNSIMQGSLKTTNAYCDWSAMYNVINRCNTVIHYAPLVAEKDPNYTPSDLNITIAECSFLRAYSYLTLIKTFKNVPFSFEPSIDDSEDFRVPQTSFETILDTLIMDIESCKDYAPRKYSNTAFNTGKVTRVAMYALLAELYLWRASDYNLPADEKSKYYRRCIEACDWVVNFKIQQYKNKDTNGVDITEDVDKNVWDIFGYPLLSERMTSGGTPGSEIVPPGFYANFGECRSFESIFEIPFQYESTLENNGAVAKMYGFSALGSGTKQCLRANQNLMTEIPSGNTYNGTYLFPVKTDYRSLLSFIWEEGNTFQISKYVVSSPMCSYNGTGSIQDATYKDNTRLLLMSPRVEDLHYESWILYRLPEIMLFRAEAEIELAGLIDENAVPTVGVTAYREGASLVESASDLYADAYNLITAVYIRSNPGAVVSSRLGSNAPLLSQFNGLPAFETYLMSERRRELLFEGKRFYDLVRQARREGNTDKFGTALSRAPQYKGASTQMKMKMMDFMYMPILKYQMQVNPQLVQNPAYADEEETVKN